MAAFLRYNFVSVYSSKKRVDKVVWIAVSDTFLYFFKKDRGKLIDIHLLVEPYHLSLVVGLESSSENRWVDVILLWKLELYKNLFEGLKHDFFGFIFGLFDT